MRPSMMALMALALLSGCAGTKMPKLAKCGGPYRYANIYGTVLPTLPIPGQTLATPAHVDNPAAKPSETRPGAAGAPPASAEPAPSAATTSALQPVYPSC